MKLIVGLGNPGKKYVGNRHNLGFMVADAYVVGRGLTWEKNRDLMCDLAKDGELVVIKSTTFMNSSGNAVRAASNFYKVDPKEILVINDEVDLEFGKVRLAFGGSSAGHRGVESVIEGLGTADFNRLRVGVGRPSPAASDGKPLEVDRFVLMDFLPEEKVKLEPIIALGVGAVDLYLDSGIFATMNKFN
ncbi:MAG: aminoacyl-tRNA hydrolase [Candidatus Curtissbacteria bacterium]